MAKPKVYVTGTLPPPGIELFQGLCEIITHSGRVPPTKGELVKNVEDMDALLCLLTDRVDKDVIASGRNLKVISTMSVGVEHVDVAEATKRGIYVGYTPGVLTDATADLAFGLLICSARRIVEADRYVRRGNWKIPWSPILFIGEDVWGKTLGIIGLGRIGEAVARRTRGFNMRVLYTKSVQVSPEKEKELGVEYRSLEDLLEESDFVTLHVPLTEKTYHLMNEEKFKLMKPTAMLINTSRGQTVDEKALIIALKEKRIAGAALDVFETEPINKTSPLLKMENVTLVPHIGSATKQSRSKMAEIASLNLLSVLKGKSPLFCINPEVKKVRPLSEVKMI